MRGGAGRSREAETGRRSAAPFSRRRHSRAQTYAAVDLDLVVVADGVFTEKVKLEHLVLHQREVLDAQATAAHCVLGGRGSQ